MRAKRDSGKRGDTVPGTREYTNDELLQMQLEAVKRARDMQRRASDALRSSDTKRPEPQKNFGQRYESTRTARQEREPRPAEKPVERPAEKPDEKKSQGGFLSGILGAGGKEWSNPLNGLRGMLKGLTGGLTGDGDRLLLLGMLLLLSSEGADELLLLALLYIMM